MSDAVTADSAGAEPAVPKGHPLGLYLLFGTEMWERFSYYGMRALLVLYMIEQFGWQPSNASSVYKWYTSLVYLTPLVGGFLADRFLGLRSSIMIGAVLMAIGQFLLVLDPLPIFYTALAFLIVGNGFFNVNRERYRNAFRPTTVNEISDALKICREDQRINVVVLTGGVFQNKFLSARASALLKALDFKVYTHLRVSTNDSGLPIGQIAIANARVRCA